MVLSSTTLCIQYALVQSPHIPCSSSDFSIQHISTDFSLVQESIACSDGATLVFDRDSLDASSPLHNFSPFLNHSSLLVEPSILHGELSSFPRITTSPSNETHETICDKVPFDSVAVTRRNDRRNCKRFTRRTDSDTTGISLHVQFAHVMKKVQQLPCGEKPKNALFTPFFTRNGRLYVCLLCPTKAAKTISNRTQIIQHISGGHGESRPYTCSSWCVACFPSLTFT